MNPSKRENWATCIGSQDEMIVVGPLRFERARRAVAAD